MEIAYRKDINFKLNSTIKIILRYELANSKLYKDLTVYFKVISWQSLPLEDFVNGFVLSWVHPLAAVQVDNCRWVSMKFKPSGSLNFITCPLKGVYGRCLNSEYDVNKSFRCIISCKSKLYPFLISFVPIDIGLYDKQDFNDNLELETNFKESLSLIEKLLAHSFYLKNSPTCEIKFVKRLGKGKKGSFQDPDFVYADYLINTKSARQKRRKKNVPS